MLVPRANAEAPRHGDALEEQQPEQRPTAGGVRVEQLEHVQAALGHRRQPDQVRDDAHDRDEDLAAVFATADQMRILVDERREEALHGAELRVDAEEDDHEEEHARPDGRAGQLQNARRIGEEEEAGARLRHLRHGLALLGGHVADEREDDDAGEHARAAVDAAHEDRLPGRGRLE